MATKSCCGDYGNHVAGGRAAPAAFNSGSKLTQQAPTAPVTHSPVSQHCVVISYRTISTYRGKGVIVVAPSSSVGPLDALKLWWSQPYNQKNSGPRSLKNCRCRRYCGKIYVNIETGGIRAASGGFPIAGAGGVQWCSHFMN